MACYRVNFTFMLNFKRILETCNSDKNNTSSIATENTVKMEPVCLSEKSVTTYWSIPNHKTAM